MDTDRLKSQLRQVLVKEPAIATALRNTEVELTVVLGEKMMPLATLSSLAHNQEVTFEDSTWEAPKKLCVNGIPYAWVNLFDEQGELGCEVISLITESE